MAPPLGGGRRCAAATGCCGPWQAGGCSHKDTSEATVAQTVWLVSQCSLRGSLHWLLPWHAKRGPRPGRRPGHRQLHKHRSTHALHAICKAPSKLQTTHLQS